MERNAERNDERSEQNRIGERVGCRLELTPIRIELGERAPELFAGAPVQLDRYRLEQADFMEAPKRALRRPGRMVSLSHPPSGRRMASSGDSAKLGQYCEEVRGTVAF